MSSHRIDFPARRKPSPTAHFVKKAAFTFAGLAARLDAFCARMNAGLAAVALVLALSVLATLIVRTPVAEFYLSDLQFTDGMPGQGD